MQQKPSAFLGLRKKVTFVLCLNSTVDKCVEVSLPFVLCMNATENKRVSRAQGKGNICVVFEFNSSNVCVRIRTSDWDSVKGIICA